MLGLRRDDGGCGEHRERWRGWQRTTENSIRRVDAPLGAITIRDQVRIFTTCQISPPCPQRARNYILETDWKVVFVARCMRPGVHVALPLCLPWPCRGSVRGLSVSQASPVSGWSLVPSSFGLSLCAVMLAGHSNAETGYMRSMRPSIVS